ncbi:MAG: hypothetical protein O7E51_00100 [Acidobacteria bacterium]|nr:hypothetical protein [Acidobacteriota bacterium]
MSRRNHFGWRPGVIAILAAIAVSAGWIFSAGDMEQHVFQAESQAALRRPSGFAQLVSVEPMPAVGSAMCEWAPASSQTRLVAALRQENLFAAETDGRNATVDADRAPVRAIKDTYPTFSAVAVDPVRGEIILQDENLFQIMVYDRKANTPPTATMTEPKRVIGGHRTKVEFNCGLYVDPANGDIYSVNNDTMDTLVIFSREARGDVPPDRELHTPHGTYGIAVDEENQELFLTVEHDSAVVVYPKMAQGEDDPIRLIQGDHAGLADPHGIAVDPENNWIFVANHGSVHHVVADAANPTRKNWPLTRSRAVPGSGKTLPPSITVHERTATGDAAPLRVIQGSKTQLNWPGQIYLDRKHGELFVANDGADSILVFRATDSGNVAPIRIIQGSRTQLKRPDRLDVDPINNEIFVPNRDSVLVFPREANGNVAPIRVIRGPATQLRNANSVAVDPVNDVVVVGLNKLTEYGGGKRHRGAADLQPNRRRQRATARHHSRACDGNLHCGADPGLPAPRLDYHSAIHRLGGGDAGGRFYRGLEHSRSWRCSRAVEDRRTQKYD